VAIPNANAIIGTPPAGDQASNVFSGSFTVAAAPSVSPMFNIYGAFNLFLYGPVGPNGAWVGSAQLERSFDGGTTWVVCGIGGAGQQAVYSSGLDVSIAASEPERAMLYRLRNTALSVGPLNWRVSATGVLSTTNGIPAGAVG
jgi:hypothetical protein